MTLSLTQSLTRAAYLFGHRTAISCADRTSTWEELIQRVAKLAGAMSVAGLRAGDRVGILARNSDRYIEILYATLWAGAAIVPLNWRSTPRDLSGQLAELDLTMLVIERDESTGRRAVAVPERVGVIALPGGAAAARDMCYEQLSAAGEAIDDRSRGGDSTAAILFTGGTSGRPRGVLLSHANLYLNAAIMQSLPAYHREMVHLTVAPLFHVAAASRVFAVAMAGGHHRLMSRFDLGEMTRQIARHRVTSLQLVPTMMARLVECASLQPELLSSLTDIGYGAAPIHEDLLLALQQRLPGVRLVQHYGMTETAPAVTALAPEDHLPTSRAPSRRRSVGKVLPTAEVMLANEQGARVPSGQVGEVLVRGPMVMQGYWKRPEETARALRSGWMHTGDLGYLDDGYLYIVDRIKDVIISGGENVYSIEVERALGQHPAVGECAVVGVQDPDWGERVHAIVVLRPGRSVPESALRAHCRDLLAAYKCPKTYEFQLDPLPRSAHGKVLKRLLRSRSCAEQAGCGRKPQWAQ